MSSAALEYASREQRRPGFTLYLYVAREALRPTAFGLLGLTIVVLTTHMLGYSDLVINRGVGGAAVGRMLFYEARLLVAWPRGASCRRRSAPGARSSSCRS